jgi:hypothetical protein
LGEKNKKLLITKCVLVSCVVSCGPDGKRILDVVPGGTELELKLRRGVGQAATLAIIHTSSVMEFVVHK